MTPQRFLDRFDYLRDEYLASRKARAGKIVRILQREIPNPAIALVADIGCSEGHITESLAEAFPRVVGLDIDYPSCWTRRFAFVQANACFLPLASERMDGIVVNHILEHAASPSGVLGEVWRVLKPGGVCYLAVPNRYWPLEPHYRLWFLSWLPRWLAHRYVRLAGRGNRYPEQLPTYWSIRHLTSRFSVEDLTPALLKAPERFFPDDPALVAQARRIQWLPLWLVKVLVPAAPSWVLVLRKE